MENENAKSITIANGFFRSRGFNWALNITLGLLAAFMIFQLGMYVGFRKARFAYGWGENYQRTFGGPRGGFFDDFTGRDFMNGHGLAGTIASIKDRDFVMHGADEMEKIVTVGNRTAIINGRQPIKFSDLQIGNMVTVIGRPGDDGTVTAEIIRVFNPPPRQ